MKIRGLFAPLVLGAAIGLATAPARAQVVDPCTVLTCMAGISGSGLSGGPGCVPATDVFFSIVVFDPSYDPGATSTARRAYLMTCQPGADNPINVGWVNSIIGIWGEIP
jgi:hypothetical protein